jgi:ElaB/YqjD/DUF883 family membrane-anchored ribosome-binding protein
MALAACGDKFRAKIMELYFKDLISKESSLEKLVDDLALLVQGADDFAKAVAPNLSEETREEVATRVHRLKESCQRISHQAAAGAQATDQFLKKHRYSALATIFGLGLLLGLGTKARREKKIHAESARSQGRWLSCLLSEEVDGRLISSSLVARRT